MYAHLATNRQHLKTQDQAATNIVEENQHRKVNSAIGSCRARHTRSTQEAQANVS